MKIVSDNDLLSVLRQYNPWWEGKRTPDLPSWKRVAYKEIKAWAQNPPGGRALLLSGARQIGKTTLFLQTINSLLEEGVPPTNILYATFDHPLLKLAGLNELIRLWQESEPTKNSAEYLFLDEIQATKDWQVWLKHQVDFERHRRIAVTGSATPLVEEGQESGVGRWQTIRLATLSFFEYLQIRKQDSFELPSNRLPRLFEWNHLQFSKIGDQSRALVPFFNEYLLRGGFPQCATLESISLIQKLLREDIVDKVLKRDMTALFGVRRVVEIEQTFLYLCVHNSGLLDVTNLCRDLQMKKPTVLNFITLLESTHLIYRLMPFGYGKEILRGQPKIYLADPAISPSVLLKGKSLLEDETAMGHAVETAFFKHLFTRYYQQSVAFSYWRSKKEQEIDIIATIEGKVVPFEVKYRSNNKTNATNLKGLSDFCHEQKVERAYVITREMTDFGIITLGNTPVLKIPAPLACYWLGRSEIEDHYEELS